MLLDRDMLIDGLTELGRRSAAAGKIIELAIDNGSCLMLVSNFRDASQDSTRSLRPTNHWSTPWRRKSRRIAAGRATG